MAKAEKLERAYSAIGLLRAEGYSQLNVALVANSAGIARSTLYLEDDDWAEVRAVINGKPSTRVKLTQVREQEKSLAIQRIEALAARVTESEEEIEHVQSLANIVYRELIDEVQKWFSKAAETPVKRAQTAKFINELNSTRQELERVRSESKVLQARLDGGDSVSPLGGKETIELDTLEPPGELFESFLNQLEKLVSKRHTPRVITSAYLMCGLPYSGKSAWIEAHKPSCPGVHLYVDSCAHTKDLRRFIANRIRDTTEANVNCVWFMADASVCKERASIAARGESSLKINHIMQINSIFEKPGLDEPFNSFILA